MIALCADVEVAKIKGIVVVFEETVLKLAKVNVVVVVLLW